MQRLAFVGVLALVAGCGASGSGDDSASDGEAGDTQSGDSSAESESQGDGATEATDTAADGGETESGETTATDTGDSDTDMETGTETGGEPDPRFLQIQLELENKDGEFGPYPSCTDGPACHSNPDRNVHIASDPTPEQLMQNWQNIVEVPDGVTPWVTPLDATAQMLNEVSIPDDVKARWLEWIQDGAPFD